MTKELSASIDIKENDIIKIDKEILAILLLDKTTNKNLLWATDNYTKKGPAYNPNQQIFIGQITGYNGNIIKPRTEKSKAEQQMRARTKAEVFTPSWVVNAQNNLVDAEWFGRKDVFNIEGEKSWEPTTEPITFVDKNWTDYVSAKRMEVSCGEAPYLTSRYDATTGEYIEVPNRVGLLDRKLRVVNENTNTREEWLKWAYIAVQSIYGFDWQGDNVLLARENILYTIIEHYKYKFDEELKPQDLISFAKVIAWNIWQMDGIKFVVPNSCCTETKIDATLFGDEIISTECAGCKKGNNLKHNGIYCVIKDWETHEKFRFVDMVKSGERK